MEGATLTTPSPLWAGLSHLSHELEQVGVVPACAHHFAAHGVLFAVGSESIDAEAPQQSEIFGAVVLAGAALVLAKDHIELPVQAILDVPMTSHDGEQILGGHRPRKHIKATLFLPFAVDLTRAMDLADRRQAGKAMLAAKPRRAHDTRRPPLLASVALLLGDGNRRLGRWAAGDELFGIRTQRPLIALQGQHVVAAASCDFLGHARRAMQRIGRNCGAAQVDQAQQLDGRSGFVAAAHRQRRQRYAKLRSPGRHHHARRELAASLESTAHGLAVERDLPRAAGGGCDMAHEAGKRLGEGRWDKLAKHRREGVVRRDAVGQAEHLTQHFFLLLGKAPDVGAVLGAAQHGGEGHEQYLAEIVPGVLAARIEMTKYSLDHFHRGLPYSGALPRIHNPTIGNPFPIYSNAIPLPLWGGIQGGGPPRAKPSRRCRLLQLTSRGNRVGTPTLNPSPQGGGGHRRRATCEFPAVDGEMPAGSSGAAPTFPCSALPLIRPFGPPSPRKQGEDKAAPAAHPRSTRLGLPRRR
ncbi:hypothetical protein SAZ10_24595 [Mesorhizobium sp. BAC0120]|nr:hypothetical protein [Mesorhizobium sp. BAC0120]MDW6024940.1 hypothetical protein [Mesorhizobium sp. BAC0120]